MQLRDGAEADENEKLLAPRDSVDRRTRRRAERRCASSRQIPVTAVGKIFKPALVAREIEDVVVRCEGADCGVEIETIDVTTDAKRGMVAQVRTRGSALPLRAALGRYTFAAEITQKRNPHSSKRDRRSPKCGLHTSKRSWRGR